MQQNDDMMPGDGTTANMQNAVSIFNAEGAQGDFPVLKAFQQYIDKATREEQAKARKRMVTLSIFFVCLLVVVVLTFVFILTAFINRNQALSDRLLDLALRERPREQPLVNVQPPVVQPAAPSQADLLKPVLEKIENLASAMTRPQPAATPVVVTAAPTPAVQSAGESAESKRLKEELETLRREMREDRQRREKEEAERKHREEIEAYQRKHYPEYFARQAELKADREAAPAKVAAPVKVVPARPAPVTVAPVTAEPVNVAPVTATPAKIALAKVAPTPAPTKAVPSLKNVKPIDYFSNDDDDEELMELARQAKAKKAEAEKAKKVEAEKVKAKTQAEAKAKAKAEAKAKPAAKKIPAKATPATQTLQIDSKGKDGDEGLTWLLGTDE